MPFSVDTRGIYATMAGTVGDDLTIKVGLLDLTTGAVVGTGATIVAHVGGYQMGVDYSTDGIFVLTLTDSQTTSLGAGSWGFVFRLTPPAGATQTYVHGTLKLTEAAASGGSLGYDVGIVNEVMVVVY